MRPRLVEVSMYKDWLYRDKTSLWLKTSKKVSIFRFDSELFFANSWYFEETILNFISEKEKLKYVIIDMEWVSDIDSSWIEVLENLINRLEKEEIKVYLTSLRIKVIQILEEIWFLKKFWKKNIFTKIKDALKHIEEKQWDNINLKPLFKYIPKKNNEEINENWKELLDKIDNK